MSYKKSKYGKHQLDSSASETSTESERSSESSEEQQIESIPMKNPFIKRNNTSLKQTDGEANIPYETAVFIASRSFKPKHLIGKDGKLKNDGRVLFSLADGSLRLAKATNMKDFEYSATDGHKKSHAFNDIVKSVSLTKVTSNWDKMCVVECTSIPKFNKEGFFDNSSCVNAVIMQGELSPVKPTDFDIVTRPVKAATIEFQNMFPDASPDNFDKVISYCNNDEHRLIPLNNPAALFFNRLPRQEKLDGDVSKKFPFRDHITVKAETAKKVIETTKENMQNRISYGDVTRNFSLSLYVPMPTNRKNSHESFKKGDKGGVEFQGFADFGFAMPHVPLEAKNDKGETMYDAFMNTPFFFNAKVEVTYVRRNGKMIPLK